MKEKTIKELKAEGHALLERFRSKNRLNLEQAYWRLSGAMRVNEPYAHFSAMKTREEVLYAIAVLNRKVPSKKKVKTPKKQARTELEELIAANAQELKELTTPKILSLSQARKAIAKARVRNARVAKLPRLVQKIAIRVLSYVGI